MTTETSTVTGGGGTNNAAAKSTATGATPNTKAGTTAATPTTGTPNAPIILQGYLRKLKTMRKKYFVLYGDCDSNSARLDYFDSEKKFKHSLNKNGSTAKRSIALKKCFNINKRSDTKQKYVVALYTKDDCFCVVFENESEQDKWYKHILELQMGGDVIEGDQPRPTFEHVWDVHVQRKGLGESYGILGKYRLCINNTSLSLVRIGSTTNSLNENRVANVEFSLASIRRTGVLQRYFYLEVGRVSKTGQGEIWMETEDAYIAENMYQTILFAATKNKSSKEDNLAPMIRIRSSSANEASKPITMHSRRQTHAGAKPLNFSPSSEDSHASLAQSESSSSASTVIMAPMYRQSSSVTSPTTTTTTTTTQQELTKHTSISTSTIYASSTAVNDTTTSTPATTSCTSINYSNKENNSTSSNGSILGRERCDSLPTSRNRTSSENNNPQHHNQPQPQQQPIVNTSMPPPRSIPSATAMRPHSMYNRYSNSPPVNVYPMSPPSGACSTESDGSSLSIDETDSFPDEGNGFSNLKMISSSVNSDMAIPEETMEDNNWFNDHLYGRNNMATQSLSLPINQNSLNRKGSPAHPIGSADGGSYMEMSSPCGSSPGDQANAAYMAMSPGMDCTRSMYQGSSSAHSRASSLAEENTDAYVPMSAHNQDSYVEMDGHPHHHHHHHHQRNDGMSSAASSCSITSGTPSTDMRFSEYPLEKVVSAFAQSEDDECNADMRPLRTYSVGSRLEHNKRKMRVDMINAEHVSSQSNPRVRAFSVGSRAKVPRSELYKSPLTHNAQQIPANAVIGAAMVVAGKKGKKSSSAPILVKFPGSIDRMDDLMEIDYSKNSSTPVKTSSPVPVPKVKHYMSDGLDMSPRSGRMGAPSGYVEMKPGNIPAKSSLTEHDYLDMTVGGAGSGATGTPYILSGSPIIRNLAATSPKEIGFSSLKINNNNNNDDYIDMSPKTSSVASYKSISKHNTISESPKTSSEDYLNMSPGEKMLEAMGSLAKSNDSSSAPDGYMEMSWNHNKHKANSDAYNNSANYGKTSQLFDSRLSSLPINIQTKSGASASRPTKVLATATAVPENFLPAGQPINGQSGQSPGKSITARCDSRDSGIATPSGSQPTMFAFSPSSPKKPFIVPSASGLSELSPQSSQDTTTASIMEECEVPRKCLVDATGGSVRLSESEDEHQPQRHVPMYHPKTPTPSAPRATTSAKKSHEDRQLDDLSNEYADMSLGAPQSKKPNLNLPLKQPHTTEFNDYINFTPPSVQATAQKPVPVVATNRSFVDEDAAGDYAIMLPALTRKFPPLRGAQIATNCTAGNQSSTSATSPPAPVSQKKSMLISTVGDKVLPPTNSTGYFRPITVNRDQDTNNSSPKPFSQNRQFTQKRSSIPTTNTSQEDEPPRTSQSRPNSVNSEKFSSPNAPAIGATASTSNTRPNSANSEQLPQIISTSSSSSTLCDSKSQSPSSTCTVRQYSFNETGSTNTSRPESVTSDPFLSSRPPSVSSERELHYASLDLQPPMYTGGLLSGLAASGAAGSSSKMEVEEQKGDASTSPSPNVGCVGTGQPSAFTYAKIDFIKSENLKAQQLQQQQQQQQQQKQQP